MVGIRPLWNALLTCVDTCWVSISTSISLLSDYKPSIQGNHLSLMQPTPNSKPSNITEKIDFNFFNTKIMLLGFRFYFIHCCFKILCLYLSYHINPFDIDYINNFCLLIYFLERTAWKKMTEKKLKPHWKGVWRKWG